MRALTVLITLLVSGMYAQADVSQEELALELAASARHAAMSIEPGSGYGELLDVMSKDKLEASDWAGQVFFVSGWAPLEKWGIWSVGDESSLIIRVEPESVHGRLYIHGRYFQGQENTRLWLNDQLVSEAPLDHLEVSLTSELVASGVLNIRLQHIAPLSPHDVDPRKGDLRKLKFGLTELGIR